MKKDRLRRVVAGVGAGLILILPLPAAAGPTRVEHSPTSTLGPLRPPIRDANPATRARVDQAYGKLPLTFEANQGQTDAQVKFLSRARGYTLFLTPTGAVFVLTKSEQRAKRPKFRLLKPDLRQAEQMTRTVVRMKLVGANPAPRIAGLEELPGKVNYFIGNDQTKWRANVPTYARVEYGDVYPGVSLVYYGNQRQLEYDFVVAPGADPGAIRLAFDGMERLRLDERGDLILQVAGADLRQRAPFVYQTINGERREISGRYVLEGKDRVSFQVAAYDRTRPLVIDPVLLYSTYLGGSGSDTGAGIAVDGGGNAYVLGHSASPDFPTTPGAFQTAFTGAPDVWFVAKLNPTGSGLVYSTYLRGGSGSAIAVDADGNAYVTGSAFSPNFPTTPEAFQPNCGTDAFVSALNPSGSGLVYSTCLGGSEDEMGRGIAVDAARNAYVTGATTSNDFPTTPGAFQPALTGGRFPQDAFVSKLNPTGSGLVYSTYLGGDDFDEEGRGIAVDTAGNAYVTGVTRADNFPTTPGGLPDHLDWR